MDLYKEWIDIRHDRIYYSNNRSWIDYEKTRACLSHKTPFAVGVFVKCGLHHNYYWTIAVF